MKSVDAFAYGFSRGWIFCAYSSHVDVMLVLVACHFHYGRCRNRPGGGGGNVVLAVPFAVLRRPTNPMLVVCALAFGFVGSLSR